MIRTTVDHLAETLAPGQRSLVSIVGGGGKTTTLFALGAQLSGSRILTTTTKMGSERDDDVAVLIAPTDVEIVAALRSEPQALVWSERVGHRAEGVAAEACDRWFSDATADHVIVEADGSRRRPFKAPYAYEPVVPAQTTLLVACIGASALGGRIDEVCHRTDAVAALLDVAESDVLTPERAATVLLSDRGSRKAQPAQARFAIAIHQVTAANLPLVERLAEAIDGRAPVVAIDAITVPAAH